MAVHGDPAYFYRQNANQHLPALGSVDVRQRAELVRRQDRLPRSARVVECWGDAKFRKCVEAGQAAVFHTDDLKSVLGYLRTAYRAYDLEARQSDNFEITKIFFKGAQAISIRQISGDAPTCRKRPRSCGGRTV